MSMKKEHKVYDEEFKKTIVSLCESGKKKSDLTRFCQQYENAYYKFLFL